MNRTESGKVDSSGPMSRLRFKLGAPDPLGLGESLGVAATFGLVSGLVDAAYRAAHLRVTGQMTVDFWTEDPGVWLVPATNAILFALLGLGIGLMARKWPRIQTIPALVFIYTTLSLFILVRAHAMRLHVLAALILTLGLASTLARFARRRPGCVRRGLGRTGRALGGAVVLMAAGFTAWPHISERRAVAALPEAAEDAPNVLLIILDTVRASSMGLYGHERPTTPNLDALAARGVVFDRAFATAPWTLPTHATLFTSRYAGDLSVGWRTALDDRWPTLAEELDRVGYVSAGFVANLAYCRAETGLGRGFHRYEDYDLSLGTVVGISWVLRQGHRWLNRLRGRHSQPVRKWAPDINEAFLDWLADRPDRPFFAFLNYFDAHDPFQPPGPYDTRFSDGTGRYWLDNSLSLTGTSELEDAYDNSLAYLDDRLGELFRRLEENGVLADTWVVITSDHGEQFGEHGLVGHGNSLYTQVLHVPLIVLPPEGDTTAPRGARVAGAATLRDFAASAAEWAGLAPHPFAGRPWSAQWGVGGDSTSGRVEQGEVDRGSPVYAEAEGRSSPTLIFASRNGPLVSLLRDGMHYIRAGDGSEELYDLDRDILEETDLSGVEASADQLWTLRIATDSILSTLTRPHHARSGVPLDEGAR